MKVIWDLKKAKINWLKHHIYFSDAETALYDPHALSIADPDVEGEDRYITTACDALGRILTVVYTYRGDELRIISARKATQKERNAYEK